MPSRDNHLIPAHLQIQMRSKSLLIFTLTIFLFRFASMIQSRSNLLLPFDGRESNYNFETIWSVISKSSPQLIDCNFSGFYRHIPVICLFLTLINIDKRLFDFISVNTTMILLEREKYVKTFNIFNRLFCRSGKIFIIVCFLFYYD